MLALDRSPARRAASACENRDVSDYYDLAAANERLAELRPVLEGLRQDRDSLAEATRELERLVEGNGSDEHQTELARRRADIKTTADRMKAAVGTIHGWGVTLRDIPTGLIDFPALANGRPIWLCWKLDEEDIAWWHEIDTGIAGRQPLIELE